MFKMKMLKNFIVFFSLIFLLSCTKQPQIMTQDDYISLGLRMYCYNKEQSQIFKIFPETVSCSMNSEGLKILAYNNSTSYKDRFKLSIYSNFRTKGEFELNEISSRKWGVISLYDDDDTYYTQESSNYENYLNVDQIDKTKKTISGSFMINGFEAFFDNLAYSDGLSEASFLNSLELNYYGSDSKSTNYVDRRGDELKAYFSDKRVSFIVSDWTEDIHYLNDDALKYSNSAYDSNPYSNSGGHYKISKVEIEHHVFTQIVINTTLHNKYFTNSIELVNSVFLIY